MTRAGLCLWCLGLLLLARGALALDVAQQGNQLLIDGVPTPLTFARGVTDPVQLPAYRALGFNTLLVRIESPGAIPMEKAQELLEAGEQAGLYLLIELANGSWSTGQYACLSDPDYVEMAGYFIKDVIPRLKDSPRLVGWVIDTVGDEQLVTQVTTLPRFLQERYGTVPALNEAWSVKTEDGRLYRTRINAFSELTEARVSELAAGSPAPVARRIRRDLELYRKLAANRDADFQRYLEGYYRGVAEVNERWGFKFPDWKHISVDVLERREQTMPGAAPLAQLELARYRSQARRGLLDWWAYTVKSHDADHLVFAGGMSSYRTLSALPSTLNGVITGCYPGVAEVDLEEHNPHAIDVARHANRFIVLAGLSARRAGAARFATYLYGAALHGAAGVGIDDWAAIEQSREHGDTVRTALDDLARRRLFNRVPAPHLAIVYSPYAPGAYTSNRPLYGYLPRFLSDGPGVLMFMLRGGTSYGQLDYLAPDDLLKAPLSRYRVLLLPSALDIPTVAAEPLRRFVEGGGVLVGDLGAGTLQAGGNMVTLPRELTDLFRVQSHDVQLADVRLNMEVYRAHPAFPRLVAGLRTIGLFEGFAVRQVVRVVPLEGADLLFQLVAKRSMEPPAPQPYRPLPRVPTRGVFIAARGGGYTVFAPFPLYQCWLPGNILFEEFHRDLFGQRSELMFERPIDLLPPRASLAGYADGSVALWARDDLHPVAWLRNPARRLYQLPGGACEVAPDGTKLYAGSAGYHLAEPLPAVLGHAEAPVRVGVQQYDERGLVLVFQGHDGVRDTTLNLHIGSGAYPIAPEATHRLTVLTPTGARVSEVRADENGWLHLEVPLMAQRTILSLGGGEVMLEQPTTAPTGARDVEIDAIPEAVLPDGG